MMTSQYDLNSEDRDESSEELAFDKSLHYKAGQKRKAEVPSVILRESLSPNTGEGQFTDAWNDQQHRGH